MNVLDRFMIFLYGPQRPVEESGLKYWPCRLAATVDPARGADLDSFHHLGNRQRARG